MRLSRKLLALGSGGVERHYLQFDGLADSAIAPSAVTGIGTELPRRAKKYRQSLTASITWVMS